MGRWQPDARGRLQTAALAVYDERGFENTTVAEIAERAGLTKRTFFRYFTDKREVLFSGAEQLEELWVTEVAAAPESAAPLDAVAVALDAVAAVFQTSADHRRESGAARARADQAGLARRGRGGRAAPPWRRRPRRDPRRGDRSHCLQGRVRALGR
jgi:AcrR family transcriptional regulator